MDERPIRKYRLSDKRKDLIEEILDRLVHLEDLHAEPLGFSPTDPEIGTLHTCVPDRGHARDDGEGEGRGLDGASMGQRPAGERGVTYYGAHREDTRSKRFRARMEDRPAKALGFPSHDEGCRDHGHEGFCHVEQR